MPSVLLKRETQTLTQGECLVQTKTAMCVSQDMPSMARKHPKAKREAWNSFPLAFSEGTNPAKSLISGF